MQEIQTFAGGCLAGITAKLTVRSEEATYFDRKEKMKKSSSIWALGPEVEGDDMRKLIANRIENARQQSCPNERTELPSLHEDEYDRQYARTIADHGNSP